MSRPWTDEDYEHAARLIEQWRAEAHRMWVNAENSIFRVKRLQDKLHEQRRTFQNTHRVAPWVEE